MSDELETKIVSAEQLRVLCRYAVERDYDHIPSMDKLDEYGYSLLVGCERSGVVHAKVFAKIDGSMIPYESFLTISAEQWDVLMSLTDYSSLKKALDIKELNE